MIQLPSSNRAFDWENNFYLTCHPNRIGKLITHWELFKKTEHLSGSIVECGVFKGATISKFASFRHFTGKTNDKKLIGFDTFNTFPETKFTGDIEARNRFIEEAGENSISKEQLTNSLSQRSCGSNLELIEGNICDTVPKYIEDNPEFEISLLNLDTDIYEPAKVILEYLYPRIVKGGILILDDYGVFPGETKAVDEYFKGQNVEIQKLSYNPTPSFVVKK